MLLMVGSHYKNFTEGFAALSANLMEGKPGNALFSSENAVPLLPDLPDQSLIDLWQLYHQLRHLETASPSGSFGHGRIT